ncbi:MAG: hypothetical protein NC131_22105 [Roseburia sp.]|nr:hypothetical protein [Roseburia sp.]
MLNFLTLYGKQAAAVLFAVGLVTGGFCLFWKGWRDYGIVSDGAGVVFTQSIFEEKPVIDAKSRRVRQNETVKWTELATARDGNGDDLTDRLVFTDPEGKQLSGYVDSRVPGQYPIRIRVRSPVSGQESEKEILILVDGRVSG